MHLCKRPELIVSRDQRRTTAKSTFAKCVVHIKMSSEGIELDDNSVLARAVTSKT